MGQTRQMMTQTHGPRHGNDRDLQMYDSQAWDEDDTWRHDAPDWQMGGSLSNSWGSDDTWRPDPDSKLDEWADDSWQADPAHAHDAAVKPTPEHQTSYAARSNINDLVKAGLETGSTVTYTQNSGGLVTLTMKPEHKYGNRWETGAHTQWHANKLRRAMRHRESQQSGCQWASSSATTGKITTVTMCANCDIRQPSTRCPQVMCTPCCFATMNGMCTFADHTYN